MTHGWVVACAGGTASLWCSCMCLDPGHHFSPRRWGLEWRSSLPWVQNKLQFHAVVGHCFSITVLKMCWQSDQSLVCGVLKLQGSPPHYITATEHIPQGNAIHKGDTPKGELLRHSLHNHSPSYHRSRDRHALGRHLCPTMPMFGPHTQERYWWNFYIS